MESNRVSQPPLDTRWQLTEPHFDEEATLLSARPVVPLREVEAKSRTRKKLIYGLTMTLAMIAGALGASVFYKHRNQAQPGAFVQTDALPPAGSSLGPTAGAGGMVTSQQDREPAASTTAEETQRSAPNTQAIHSEARSAVAEQSRSRDEVRTGESRERQALRTARREQQLRRVEDRDRALRREARDSRSGARDVLRIREIFEGSPRPE